MTPTLDADDRALIARAVRRACPRWLRHEQDDLVQMTVMRVLRAGARLENRQAYLCQAARSTVLDEIRRKRHRTEVGMRTSLRGRLVDSRELTPETRVRGSQVGRAIEAAIDQVTPTRRQAVKLYLEDRKIPEVAETLGQDRKKTANQVYRGLADLRAILEAEGLRPAG
jgi:RNA polymerase sigma factor (sigma-70 family)